MILGGGPEQVIVYRIARELGHRTICVDDNPAAPAGLVADEQVSIRIKDHEALRKLVREKQPDGILTHAAELSIEEAIAREVAGHPGLSVEAASASTLKELRTPLLNACGVPVPKFQVLPETIIDSVAPDLFDTFGFPLVIKPNNQKGAAGVCLINSHEDLGRYRERHMVNAASGTRFLIETYLEGIQYSTESIVKNGGVVWTSTALRHYGRSVQRFKPYLIEDGHSMPAELDAGFQRSFEEIMNRIIEAYGMENGVLKGDFIEDAVGNLTVIEMATRSSGGRFADRVTPLHCGVNLVYALIDIALGREIDEATLRPGWNRGVSQRFIFLPNGASVCSLGNLDRIRNRQGVVELVLSDQFLKHRRQPPVFSHGDRIGYVICTGVDRASADITAKEVVAEITHSFVYED